MYRLFVNFSGHRDIFNLENGVSFKLKADTVKIFDIKNEKKRKEAKNDNR